MLESERLPEIVFAKGPPLEQERSDPSSGEVLNFEGSGELGFRDQVGPDEKLADSRFQSGTDYRAAGGARLCLRPRGRSTPAPRLSVKEAAPCRSGWACYIAKREKSPACRPVGRVARSGRPGRGPDAGGAEDLSSGSLRRGRRKISRGPRSLPARHRTTSGR